MYVGKCVKSILSVLLICGLLLVSVPCRAYAVGPVVLGPELKYAIGAGLVSGGLYAANKDALNYAINDYWTKASDHVKQQWLSAVIYGTGVGIILLNDPVKKSINDYLDNEYKVGGNEVIYENIVEGYVSGEHYQKIYFNNGMALECIPNYFAGSGFIVTLGGNLIYQSNAGLEVEDYYFVFGTGSFSSLYLRLKWVGYSSYYKWDNLQGIIEDLYDDLVVTGSVIGTGLYEFVGDTAGFGNATEGRPDVKVPCPPVPAAEWPDTWLDNLQNDLNRTGNPTLDDETFVEEGEQEWDWYWDDNVAYIYRVPHGDPPQDPDDEPIRIPAPPPPQPEIPFPQPDPIPQPADPCPYCPPNPYPSPDGDPCPNPYCPNQPDPMPVPVPIPPNVPVDPCPYCPTNPYPSPNGDPCPNPYCPNQPNPQPVPNPPPDIQPYYDDPEIDWEPLRRMLYELTEKFPFCLPWDLMRGIQSLESSQWDRKIRIDVGDGLWPEMVIDLKMFDGIASITRVILLIVFDLGLIFGTRRLMGGDV